jgi:creatinine amidohydrolase
MAYNPEYVDREMYENLGKENVGAAGTDPGVFMIPAWATTRYPEIDIGHLDFDVEKAKTYTQIKADFISKTFLVAVKRWEMMEDWKRK